MIYFEKMKREKVDRNRPSQVERDQHYIANRSSRCVWRCVAKTWKNTPQKISCTERDRRAISTSPHQFCRIFYMCLTFVCRAAKEEATRRNNYAAILSVIFSTDFDSFWLRKKRKFPFVAIIELRTNENPWSTLRGIAPEVWLQWSVCAWAISSCKWSPWMALRIKMPAVVVFHSVLFVLFFRSTSDNGEKNAETNHQSLIIYSRREKKPVCSPFMFELQP